MVVLPAAETVFGSLKLKRAGEAPFRACVSERDLVSLEAGVGDEWWALETELLGDFRVEVV